MGKQFIIVCLVSLAAIWSTSVAYGDGDVVVTVAKDNIELQARVTYEPNNQVVVNVRLTNSRGTGLESFTNERGEMPVRPEMLDNNWRPVKYTDAWGPGMLCPGASFDFKAKESKAMSFKLSDAFQVPEKTMCTLRLSRWLMKPDGKWVMLELLIPDISGVQRGFNPMQTDD